MREKLVFCTCVQCRSVVCWHSNHRYCLNVKQTLVCILVPPQYTAIFEQLGFREMNGWGTVRSRYFVHFSPRVRDWLGRRVCAAQTNRVICYGLSCPLILSGCFRVSGRCISAVSSPWIVLVLCCYLSRLPSYACFFQGVARRVVVSPFIFFIIYVHFFFVLR